MRKLLLILSAMLLYAVQSFAGIEEVSLYTMSENWGATYNNVTKSLTFSEVVNWNKGRGWKFNGKDIDGSIASYTIEFDDATTTAIAIEVKYSYDNTVYTKTFDFAAEITSATIDMHTDFGSDTYSLDYILIKAGADCTITLKRVYFTTTDNNDLYQAENAEFAGYTENFTSADNTVVKVEDLTGDDHVTFTVNVPCKAVYRLNIGYNNGTSNNDRACNLSINNGSDIGITLPMTGDEGNKNIGEVAYSTILEQGNNTITIHGNWKWYNIDYLRVYEPQLYLIGNIHESSYNWAPNAGKLMTFDSENKVFTCTTRIGTGTLQDGTGTFAFATTLASDAGGWSYMNGHRWSPSVDNFAVDPDGKTATTNIIKQGWNSYLVPMAGTYTITMKADLSSFTIQGPEVYMFGLFEGSEYTWATNAYNRMVYNPETEKYKLRVRIADGAESSDDGEVAFATSYSDAADCWTYLNANRYGPSTSDNPTLNGTTNAIGKNGDVKFTGITAGKYEVVVDMFSATKTAQFYPLYTFGYEVVGTHGSIVCSTDENEIPLGGTPTVTATPDEGYRFVKWTDEEGTQLSTDAEYTTLPISANTWLQAHFEPDPDCLLSIAATDYAFAKLGNNVYTSNGSPFFDNGTTVSFDWSANESGAEVFYPVHLDAGTYYFYCTLDNNGDNRKMRLYEPSLSSGDLYYSGQRWDITDSHDFGGGSGTFETKGFTVTAGDYLIALFAERNTGFSHIDVVGVCDGASANTYALTLSADANGSVISDQINNDRIVSGTNILLLAEPSSGYRFDKWSDDNTDNPRSVTMSSNVSLTASFADASSDCRNTLTIQCTTDSISPITRPIASPTSTSVSGTILTNLEEGKSIYYAFEITESETCAITLLTPRSDKRQKIYLYSAQLESGTSLTYSGDTYYQVQDPTDANTSNSGTNHVYPVCSTTLELAAGKYVIGLYSEGSWSQYDRIVISAAGYGLNCSNADITINAGEQVELPHVVRNLIVHQGGSTTSEHDIKILNTITYIRPAYEEAEDGNKMNKWYPFCLPFTMSGCTVHDEGDGLDYPINPIYLQYGDAEDDPSGTGFFYLKYFNEDSKWAYINRNSPEAYKPYIILFVNHWDDTGKDDPYFENNPIVKFIGGSQTIDGSAKIDAIPAEDVEKYFYYANNTLAPIHLESAYVFDPSRNNFDYKEDVTIPPFECYIQATKTYKARHKSIAMPRKPGAQDTATGLIDTPTNENATIVYDLFGRIYSATDTASLSQGIWIVKQGVSTCKIVKQ